MMSLAVFLVVLVAALVLINVHGKMHSEHFMAPLRREMGDLHATMPSLNEHEYAWTEATEQLYSSLQALLGKHGFELITIGETLHHSLRDVTVRRKATGEFLTLKHVTFLPDPATGARVAKILIG